MGSSPLNTDRGATWASRRTKSGVAGTIPARVLENFRQIQTVEPAGTILHAEELDDAGLWGLIDALRDAGVDLIEIRRDVGPAD